MLLRTIAVAVLLSLGWVAFLYGYATAPAMRCKPGDPGFYIGGTRQQGCP